MAKSPTTSVKSREMIGVDQFSQRREVFGKHDTVFLPPQSPTISDYREVDPIITSNHGKTTTNFKRNTPGYSSMRETRTENHFDFRPRKYSDNFTSDLNQSDDVDYRRSMTERTRRLSRLRREFLTSNLHEPSESPFNRAGTRASMPAKSLTYKIESPNIYKFPFAEPFGTPQPVRRVVVDLGPVEVDGVSGKENKDPTKNTRHLSLTRNDSSTQIDHQKLFEELVKRYSPQRKPVDWQLPPTRPRVVASVPKSITSFDSSESKKNLAETINTPSDDDVFDKKGAKDTDPSEAAGTAPQTNLPQEVIQNGPETVESEENNKDSTSKEENNKKERDSKVSLTELAEKNDKVPELSSIQRQQSNESNSNKRQHLDANTDITIPALLEKMTIEGDNLENKKSIKKIKRKRSFLDKLLGRNKQK